MERNPSSYPISKCEWVSYLNKRAGNTAYVSIPKQIVYTYGLRPGMSIDTTIRSESASETWRPTIVRRCGNSISIAVPNGILKKMGLKLGMRVTMKLENMEEGRP